MLGTRAKTYGVILLVVALIDVVQLLYLPRAREAELEVLLEKKARALCNVVASSVSPALEFKDPDSAIEVFKAAGLDPDIIAATLFGVDKQVLAHHGGAHTRLRTPPTTQLEVKGKNLLASAAVDTKAGSKGTLVLTLSRATVEAGVASIRRTTIINGVFLLLLAFGVTIAMERRIVGTVDRVVEVVSRMAAGDLTVKPLVIDRADKIGQMADAVNTAVSELHMSVEPIGRSAELLATASEELQLTSADLASNSTQTSDQASRVSETSDHVSRNLQAVSQVVEQMTANVSEIASNAHEAAVVANSAVDVTRRTNDKMAQLSESSTGIGKVVKVITAIAEQTNLLALNATIEAARAGEAGKGFAVVAHEVKELARETAAATEDISLKIEAIQQDARASVEAIQQITEIIQRINDTQVTIASAVEQHTATTAEIKRNVLQAATGSNNIARAIVGVAEAATNTQSGADEMTRAAKDLARMAAQLQQFVGKFKTASS